MNIDKQIENILKNIPDIQIPVNLFDNLQSHISFPEIIPEKSNQRNIFNGILKKRIFQFAAVLLVLTGLFVAQTFIYNFGTVYGISELPKIITKASTLHIKGSAYFPDPDSQSKEFIKLDLEYWFDTRNGKYRMKKPGGFDRNNGEPYYYLTISDGQYIIENSFLIDNDKKRSEVYRYSKLSPFQAQLQVYRYSYQTLMRMFGTIEKLERSHKIGQEKIDDELYDIWQTEYTEVPETTTRLNTWFSSTAGKVGRIIVWEKNKNTNVEWRPYLELHKIELNVELPEKIFDTDIPSNVMKENTKETALSLELGSGLERYSCRDYGLYLHIGFTFPDGCVLIGWSTQHAEGTSQAEVFESLETGGHLPELPAVIEGLTAFPTELNLSYTGFHVFKTQKDGLIYEWSLYVPKGIPPGRNSLLGYGTTIKFNMDRNRFKSIPRALYDDLVIDSKDEYNRWVRGAVGELSDTKNVPDHITYEYILDIAEKIRNSYN